MIDTNDDWCRWRSILTSFAADHPQINPILSMDLWWISHSTKLKPFIVVRAGAWSLHIRDHDQGIFKITILKLTTDGPINHTFSNSKFFHVYRYHNGKRKRRRRRRRGNWWKENWCQGTLQLSIFWSPLQKKHLPLSRTWRGWPQKTMILLICNRLGHLLLFGAAPLNVASSRRCSIPTG